METTCPRCHARIEIGQWPFCPHGGGAAAVHGDEIDYVDHNLGREPIRIRSKAERRRLMKERGLVEAVRHVPHPAGPRYNQTVSWDTWDPYTAENVRILLERAFRQRDDGEGDERPCARITDNRELSPEEAAVLLSAPDPELPPWEGPRP